MTQERAAGRAREALRAAFGNGHDAQATLDVLARAGLSLADEREDELVVRWVDAASRPVPPEADTIIRTITRTIDGVSSSTTHWLEGLRSPRIAR